MVEPTAPPRWIAVCFCGWESKMKPQPTSEAAEAEWETHRIVQTQWNRVGVPADTTPACQLRETKLI